MATGLEMATDFGNMLIIYFCLEHLGKAAPRDDNHKSQTLVCTQTGDDYGTSIHPRVEKAPRATISLKK